VDPHAPAVIAEEPADPGALRVIVAEDDPTNRDLIQLFLGGLGVQPDFAINGQDLLDRLDADPGYDLVFMDMMMPVMDGMEAAKAILDRYGDDRPRMVALTARALQEDRQRVLAGGLDGFIAKPFSRDDLREALDATPIRPKGQRVEMASPIESASAA
jgi:CheY-like chemotaxis protein